MQNQMTVGDPAILLMGTAEQPEQVVATVASFSGDVVTLTFATPTTFAKMARGAIVVGPEGARQAGVAVYAQQEDGGSVFRVLGGWRPFVVRARDRFATDVGAKVRAQGLGRLLLGRLVDVSVNGGAIRVPEPIPSRFLELALAADSFETWIPCDVVEHRTEGEAQVVHVRFGDAGVAGRALIRQLVDAATPEPQPEPDSGEGTKRDEAPGKTSRRRKAKRPRGTWGAAAQQKEAS